VHHQRLPPLPVAPAKPELLGVVSDERRPEQPGGHVGLGVGAEFPDEQQAAVVACEDGCGGGVMTPRRRRPVQPGGRQWRWSPGWTSNSPSRDDRAATM
jgi:hypothetical protein